MNPRYRITMGHEDGVVEIQKEGTPFAVTMPSKWTKGVDEAKIFLGIDLKKKVCLCSMCFGCEREPQTTQDNLCVFCRNDHQEKRPEARDPVWNSHGGWVICGGCGRLYHKEEGVGKWVVQVISECQVCEGVK